MTGYLSEFPCVSVVTVFHNRALLVKSSLGSLLDQTYGNLEIIAVDDGSTDDTFAQMCKFSDDRLHLLTQRNSGFTNAMIWAIAKARGSIIAVHDAGDVSYPDRIAQQVDVLLARPEVGVVGCLVKNPIIGTKRTKILGVGNGLDFRKALLRENIFTHGEVTFRKSVYDQVGGYRSFFRFAQDLDLWLRMSAVCDYHTVQQLLYERFDIPGSVSGTPEKSAMQQRFSEVARQSAEAINAGGRDLVDLHGADAMAHMQRSRRLAAKLMRGAQRRAIRSRDFHGALVMARAAITHRPTRRTSAFCWR